MSSPHMAGSGRRYARKAWLAAKGTVGGGLSAVELNIGAGGAVRNLSWN